MAEFPAVFVSLDGVHTDGVGCLVHESAVANGEHVVAETGVDGGTAKLIRSITTVIVSVAPPCCVNASSVGTFPVVDRVTSASKFVTGIKTVIVSITLPSGIDTSGCISTFELSAGAGASAVSLVPAISAIIISVTNPGSFDTEEVVTLDLAGWALNLVAVNLVSGIATIIISITLVLPGDATSVLALKLVLTGAVGGASLLVRHITTIILSVAKPVDLDTATVLALELVWTTWYDLPLVLAAFSNGLLGTFLGLGNGEDHQKSNQTELNGHHCEISR